MENIIRYNIQALEAITGKSGVYESETNKYLASIDGVLVEVEPEVQVIIENEVTRLQAEYDSKQYARDRAEAYPSLQDQADMQFHDLANGTTTWLDAIQAVKDAYPKPV